MYSSTFAIVVIAVLFQNAVSSVNGVDPVQRHSYHSSPKVTCRSAYKKCDFRFNGYYSLPYFWIGGKPDVAFTPRIVSKVAGENLGILNTNNIAPEFILSRGVVSRITNFGDQKFTPTHFKPFTIKKNRKKYTPWSGVGHQTFHGNQLSVADGKCLRIYFTHYQTVDPYTGYVTGNRNDVPRSANKCVVFKMYA